MKDRGRAGRRAGPSRGGVRRALAALAAGAPARVFVAVGRGGRAASEALGLDPRLRFVESPRSAEVFLLVGGAAPGLVRPAAAVHDQLSRPRATVWWTVGADPRGVRRLARRFGAITLVGEEEGPAGAVAAILRRRRELLGPEPPATGRGPRREGARDWAGEGCPAGEPEVLPDREPVEWRGVGPHGQGGEGMTGGAPYGRPMAERSPARDGLALDRLPVRLGPFYPHLPPGLVLELALQGDVVQEAAVGPNPFRRLTARSRRREPFVAVLAGPVPVAVLEAARAAYHLRWLARTLRLHGLPALGERALRLAIRVETGSAEDAGARAREVRRLERVLRGTGMLRWATAGVGALAAPVGRGAGGAPASWSGLGPVARAAGLADDLRRHAPVYGELGFEPVVGRGGGDPGAWGRLLQRLGEAAQGLELAGRAVRRGGPTLGPVSAVEAPRGRLVAGGEPPGARLLALVPEILAGCEWGDALAAVASLDLDLEEAGPPADEEAA